MSLPQDASSKEIVIAISDYKAAHDEQLTFFKGDQLNIIEKVGAHWWWAEKDGRYGYIPVNHTTASKEVDKKNVKGVLWQNEEYYDNYGQLRMKSVDPRRTHEKQDVLGQASTRSNSINENVTLDVFRQMGASAKFLSPNVCSRETIEQTQLGTHNPAMLQGLTSIGGLESSIANMLSLQNLTNLAASSPARAPTNTANSDPVMAPLLKLLQQQQTLANLAAPATPQAQNAPDVQVQAISGLLNLMQQQQALASHAAPMPPVGHSSAAVPDVGLVLNLIQLKSKLEQQQHLLQHQQQLLQQQQQGQSLSQPLQQKQNAPDVPQQLQQQQIQQHPLLQQQHGPGVMGPVPSQPQKTASVEEFQNLLQMTQQLKTRVGGSQCLEARTTISASSSYGESMIYTNVQGRSLESRKRDRPWSLQPITTEPKRRKESDSADLRQMTTLHDVAFGQELAPRVSYPIGRGSNIGNKRKWTDDGPELELKPYSINQLEAAENIQDKQRWDLSTIAISDRDPKLWRPASVQSMQSGTQIGVLWEPRDVFGFVEDNVSLSDPSITSLVMGQYEVAARQGNRRWIEEARHLAPSLFHAIWKKQFDSSALIPPTTRNQPAKAIAGMLPHSKGQNLQSRIEPALGVRESHSEYAPISAAMKNRKSQPNKEITPSQDKSLFACPSRRCNLTHSSNLRLHVTKMRHLPNIYSHDWCLSTNDYINDKQVEGLKFLANLVFKGEGTLKRLGQLVMAEHTFPPGALISQEYQDYMSRICARQRWRQPTQFTLTPLNSAACLLHYRVLLYLIDRSPPEHRRRFFEFGSLNKLDTIPNSTAGSFQQATKSDSQQNTNKPLQSRERVFSANADQDQSLSASKRLKKRLQKCPIEKCSVVISDVKSHFIQHHILNLFVLNAGEHSHTTDRQEKRAKGLKCLAHILLGKPSSIQELVNFINTKCEMPDIPVTKAEDFEMRDFSRHIVGRRPRRRPQFKLIPMNSPACLLHWRALLCLTCELKASLQRIFFRAPLRQCPISDCKMAGKDLKLHVFNCHLPGVFKQFEVSGNKEPTCLYGRRSEGIRQLANYIFGKHASLDDLMDLINTFGEIEETEVVSQMAKESMVNICRFEGWEVPSDFSIKPVNCHAALTHWRVIVYLIDKLDKKQALSFKTEYDDRFKEPQAKAKIPFMFSSATKNTSDSSVEKEIMKDSKRKQSSMSTHSPSTSNQPHNSGVEVKLVSEQKATLTDGECCPIPGCNFKSSRISTHFAAHIPHLYRVHNHEYFQVNTSFAERRAHGLKTLAKWILGHDATLEDLVSFVNKNNSVKDTISKELVNSMMSLCKHQKWAVPEKFTLNPINSPAGLLHKLPLMWLMTKLNGSQIVMFNKNYGPGGKPSSVSENKETKLKKVSMAQDHVTVSSSPKDKTPISDPHNKSVITQSVISQSSSAHTKVDTGKEVLKNRKTNSEHLKVSLNKDEMKSTANKDISLSVVVDEPSKNVSVELTSSNGKHDQHETSAAVGEAKTCVSLQSSGSHTASDSNTKDSKSDESRNNESAIELVKRETLTGEVSKACQEAKSSVGTRFVDDSKAVSSEAVADGSPETSVECSEPKYAPDGEKNSLITHVDEKEVKHKKGSTNACPIAGCNHRSTKPHLMNRHIFNHHVPCLLQVMTTREAQRYESFNAKRVEAIETLAKWILGEHGTPEDLVDYVDRFGVVTSNAKVALPIQQVMRNICSIANWPKPKEFTLLPLNSPAVLLSWKPMIFLVGSLKESQIESFYKMYSVTGQGDMELKPGELGTDLDQSIISDISAEEVYDKGMNDSGSQELTEGNEGNEQSTSTCKQSFSVSPKTGEDNPVENQPDEILDGFIVLNDALSPADSDQVHDDSKTNDVTASDDSVKILVDKPETLQENDASKEAMKHNKGVASPDVPMNTSDIQRDPNSKSCEGDSEPTASKTVSTCDKAQNVDANDDSIKLAGKGQGQSNSAGEFSILLDDPLNGNGSQEDTNKVSAEGNCSLVAVSKSSVSEAPPNTAVGNETVEPDETSSQDQSNSAGEFSKLLDEVMKLSRDGIVNVDQVHSIEECAESTAVAVTTDQKETKGRAFDSYFHSNEQCHSWWDSDEDEMSGVDGGLMVINDPDDFKYIHFPVNPHWKIGVGIDPVKIDKMTEEYWCMLEEALRNPDISALGSVGLDWTVPPSCYEDQEKVLNKVLDLGCEDKVLVLHVRGPHGDALGTGTHAECLETVRDHCSKKQKILLHCFCAGPTQVRRWTKAFPNCHFSFSGLVESFNDTQKEALCSVPIDKLLLETNLPFSCNKNLKANIRHVAEKVAALRMIPVSEVLEASLVNAERLFDVS